MVEPVLQIAEPYASVIRERIVRRSSAVDGGCWVWSGWLDRHGYGGIVLTPEGRRDRKITGAHRAAWLVFRGRLEPAQVIDHLCRVRACCNPWHMEPVSNQENISRGVGPGMPDGRGRPRIRVMGGLCAEGHLLTEKSSRLQSNRAGYTTLICRQCQNARRAAWGARQALPRA